MNILDLPDDILNCIIDKLCIDLIGHATIRSLKQTCKLFHDLISHMNRVVDVVDVDDVDYESYQAFIKQKYSHDPYINALFYAETKRTDQIYALDIINDHYSQIIFRETSQKLCLDFVGETYDAIINNYQKYVTRYNDDFIAKNIHRLVNRKYWTDFLNKFKQYWDKFLTLSGMVREEIYDGEGDLRAHDILYYAIYTLFKHHPKTYHRILVISATPFEVDNYHLLG